MWFQEWWNTILVFFAKVWAVTDREYASMPKLFHLDDYDHCMLYGKDALYCSVSLQLRPSDHDNVPKVWEILQTASPAKRFYKHDLLRHGICVTERCPDLNNSRLLKYDSKEVKLLNDCYNANFENMDLIGDIEQIYCENNQARYSPNEYDILFAVLMLAFVMLALFAWYYDAVHKPNLQDQTFKNSRFGKYISSFSVYQNWKRLTHINLTNPDVKALSCLQGLRLYSVSQVIVSHTYTTHMAVPVENPRFLEQYTDRKYDQFLSIATRINFMQLFFLMSTWLAVFSFYQESSGKKNVTFSFLIKRLINRYLRLTPLMAIVVLFEATWIPYFSNGPLWDSIVGMEYKLCRKNWWTNLLYINNFWPFNELCASHLWSQAVDMQFYITTLLILWLIWRHPKRAPWILGTIWVLHIFASLHKIAAQRGQFVPSPEATYNLTLVNVADHMTVLNDNMMNIPGLLAGIIYARLFYQYKNQNVFTKKIHVVMWWIVCWGTIIGTLVAPGIIINFLNRNLILLFVYMCFSKTFFIGAVGLTVFGVTQGQGGFVKKFYEWPPFYILGRLTYAAYLIHPLLQRYRIAVIRAPTYISDFNLAFDSVSFLTWSFLLAIPVTLFFEMPFEQIRRHILSKPEKKVATNSVKTD